MDQFKDLNATHLYCPKCGAAMPVRERLLLILPDGALYEYMCAKCGASLGKRKTREGRGAPPRSVPGGIPRFM